MSIIDAHAYLGEGRHLQQTVDELLALMDEADVELAVVCAVDRYLAVDNAGFKLDSVEGGRSVRSVPDFSAARPMPMSGPDGVVRLVPRYYHHPHLDGYRAAKGDVIAFQPPVELAFSFAPSCSGPANCPSHVFGI